MGIEDKLSWRCLAKAVSPYFKALIGVATLATPFVLFYLGARLSRQIEADRARAAVIEAGDTKLARVLDMLNSSSERVVRNGMELFSYYREQQQVQPEAERLIKRIARNALDSAASGAPSAEIAVQRRRAAVDALGTRITPRDSVVTAAPVTASSADSAEAWLLVGRQNPADTSQRPMTPPEPGTVIRTGDAGGYILYSQRPGFDYGHIVQNATWTIREGLPREGFRVVLVETLRDISGLVELWALVRVRQPLYPQVPRSERVLPND